LRSRWCQSGVKINLVSAFVIMDEILDSGMHIDRPDREPRDIDVEIVGS
jgi:hypothetical protein